MLSCYNRFFICFVVVTGPVFRRGLVCCLKLLLTLHFARHCSCWLFVLVTNQLLLLCTLDFLHLSTFSTKMFLSKMIARRLHYFLPLFLLALCCCIVFALLLFFTSLKLLTQISFHCCRNL